jgi:filamentous hemagglutinin
MNTELAFKQAGILDEKGRLTQKAVDTSLPARSSEMPLSNPGVVSELTKDGSRIEDWEKRTTLSVALPSGESKQIHFYKNKVTGKVNYSAPSKLGRSCR